jgi:methionyl-tRNA synthetase
MPETMERALKIFDLTKNDIDISSLTNHEYLKAGSQINKIGILFKKIEKQND